MSQPSKTIKLTSAEVQTLIRVINCQYDISDDTATDDIFISVTDSGIWSREKVIEVRKSTSERINILVMLTHTLALLNAFPDGFPLTLSEKDMVLLYNEIDMHLYMLDDMLMGEDEEDIHDKVKHIVNINLILQRLK